MKYLSDLSGHTSCKSSNARETRVPACTTTAGVDHQRPISLSDEFLAAASSQEQISDCPHNLYKYPARFSPEFAREAIQTFSSKGELIIDCFSGGGTALIEAVSLGRYAVGFDISTLACFLARAKSTPLSIHDVNVLEEWIFSLEYLGTGPVTAEWSRFDTADGYYRRNLPNHIVEVFSAILSSVRTLAKKKQQAFSRLVLLSVGQALLDCKQSMPKSEHVLREFCRHFRECLAAHRDYTWCLSRRMGVMHGSLQSRRRIINASSENAATDRRVPSKWGKASLVVTSPPYPGVHMLYHRWQVLGRRETPAPFLLANCRDGDGEAYYCLGGRKTPGLNTYFSKITDIFKGVRTHLHRDALVIQMVAFNDPASQLTRYLESMELAGYIEAKVSANSNLVLDGRLWRHVPGRKWYVATRGSGAASKEVVLFHRLKAG